MSDLSNLDGVSGQPLSAEQIHGILGQIDLDLMNLVRDGKLSAARYQSGGAQGQSMDRSSNLQSLLAARDYYQNLLSSMPVWSVQQAENE